MSDCQHAPGPWAICSTEGDLVHANAEALPSLINGHRQYRICKMQWNGWQTVERQEGAVRRKRNVMVMTDVDRANLHLIAAAPEMLAGLKIAVERIAASHHPNKADAEVATADLRAIIAKAEGRADG